MDIGNILAFMAVASLLVISPGPNGLLIAKNVPLFGKKVGFANVGGFVCAFYVHGTLSILGISLLLVQSAQAFAIIKLLGAAYLIWIGIKAMYSAIKSSHPNGIHLSTENRIVDMPIFKAFFEGFLTNVLNPKVSLFYLAAFPQFIPVHQDPINSYALVTAHALVNLLWFSSMVLILNRVKHVTNSARFKKWLNSITGAVFIGFGSKLALMKSG
ncbi:LysE family translocator [Gynuella sunshinyii]|uniref:Putative threonine efflux protein n=1 Tax=Gynuella sunshinyii YC6258 TaxID=1445510 RepID=A0A0C5VRF4_9GAMM|nr:LysE family translocator [Gynuella sunshinyii]AJQ97217.1 putative threonine efflux protein [Gynuella sunshinyii YC6258]